jgi:AcrR family transcriptional regulator
MPDDVTLPKPQRRGRRRGAGAGPAETRRKLLSAAAEMFADRGFHAVSIRAISAKAGVNSALLNYHFGSKEALFEEVIRIHAADHVSNRLHELVQARQRKGDLELLDILSIYLEPLFRRGIGEHDLFARLHAVMVMERSDVLDEIASRAFGSVNIAFIDELHRCLPHLPRPTIIWRLFAVIGAMLFLDTRPSPPSLLTVSAGACDPADAGQMRRHLLPFFAEGMRAPLSDN